MTVAAAFLFLISRFSNVHFHYNFFNNLQVGTEAEPFQHKAEIVMHGHLRSKELPIYGAKTLGVREGTLDLHGKPIIYTWTLLAATANVGATQVREFDLSLNSDDDKVIFPYYFAEVFA